MQKNSVEREYLVWKKIIACCVKFQFVTQSVLRIKITEGLRTFSVKYYSLFLPSGTFMTCTYGFYKLALAHLYWPMGFRKTFIGKWKFYANPWLTHAPLDLVPWLGYVIIKFCSDLTTFGLIISVDNICNPGTIEANQTATNPKQKVRQIYTGAKAIGVRSYHRN